MCDIDGHCVKRPGVAAAYHVPPARGTGFQLRLKLDFLTWVDFTMIEVYPDVPALHGRFCVPAVRQRLPTFPREAVAFHVPAFVRSIGSPRSRMPLRTKTLWRFAYHFPALARQAAVTATQGCCGFVSNPRAS